MSQNSLLSEAPHSTRRLEWSLHPAEEEDPDTEDDTPQVEPGNVPRVARLMALAIHFEGMLRRGEVPDYATLARLGHVTRARMSQIMDLLSLAPDIQEAILFLPRTAKGRDPVTERHLRAMTAVLDWERQRHAWRRLRQQRSGLAGCHRLEATGRAGSKAREASRRGGKPRREHGGSFSNTRTCC